ncbi:MAG: hypothetical protein K0U98_25985 [Deltaproteobacteria bacterium]|nr:hypothetical protein [Deltaproteobacteria bacterium]
MKSKGHKHLAERSLLVSPQDLDSLRKGECHEEAFSRLHDRCLSLTESIKPFLSRADREDIVSESIIGVLDSLFKSERPAEEVDRQLRSAIRQRASALREILNTEEELVRRLQEKMSQRQFSHMLDLQYLAEIAVAARNFIEIALERIPQQSRDLLIEELALDELGLALGESAACFLASDAREEAVFQAYEVFLDELLGIFQAARADRNMDHDVIESAISLIEGARPEQISTVIREMEKYR